MSSMRDFAGECWFLSCSLDPDEREPRIESKRRAVLNPSSLSWIDPSTELEKRVGVSFFKIEVESWLRPVPDIYDLPMLTVDNFVAFIDSNGCYEYAEEVFKACVNHAEGIPVMVGVDHSLSGGLAEYLSNIYENLVYVVLDAHFDAIIPEIRCNLIQYDAETNPESRYSLYNPYIYGRPNSYNADSYLYHLWENNIVNPENTVVAGVADYPPEHAWEIDDERVKKYLDFYTGFEKQGVKIIQRDRLRSNPAGFFKKVMKGFERQPVLLSIDLDVASGTCISGVRFNDYNGIGCKPFIDSVIWIIKNCNVVGLDICEFDPLSAKKSSSSIELTIEVLEVFNSINSK